MLLLLRGAIGRAHHPAGVGAAVADADTAQHGPPERVVVLREPEVRRAGERAPARAEPEVLVGPVRRDDLARVHPVVRIEQRLQLTERRDDFTAEHLRQQLAARLPVPVLTGERTAVRDDQVGRPGQKPAELRNPLRLLEGERDTGVHTPLTEVPVQGRVIVVELREQLLQIPQIVAQSVRRHRGVLPALPGLPVVRRPGGDAQPRLPRPEHLLFALRIVRERHRRVVLPPSQRPQQLLPLRVDLLEAFPAELHQQPAVAVRQALQRIEVGVLLPHQLRHPAVQRLQLGRAAVLQQAGHVVRGRTDVLVTERDDGIARRHRHQVQLGVENGHQRSLAAHQGLGEIEVVLRQQGIQVVAGHPAGDTGIAAPHLGQVPVDEPSQPLVDLRATATALDDPGIVVVRRRPDPHPGPVVGEDVQPPHVVHGLPVRLRGGAARVVADHPAQRTVTVGGRLRPEIQPRAGELTVEIVQDDTGLDHTAPPLRIERHQAVAVLRPVEDDSGVGALPRQARPTTTGEHRRTELRADTDGRRTGLDTAGHHHTDRHLTVVRPVGAVRPATSRVEAHLGVHPFTQRPGQRGRPGAVEPRGGGVGGAVPCHVVSFPYAVRKPGAGSRTRAASCAVTRHPSVASAARGSAAPQPGPCRECLCHPGTRAETDDTSSSVRVVGPSPRRAAVGRHFPPWPPRRHPATEQRVGRHPAPVRNPVPAPRPPPADPTPAPHTAPRGPRHAESPPGGAWRPHMPVRRHPCLARPCLRRRSPE